MNGSQSACCNEVEAPLRLAILAVVFLFIFENHLISMAVVGLVWLRT